MGNAEMQHLVFLFERNHKNSACTGRVQAGDRQAWPEPE